MWHSIFVSYSQISVFDGTLLEPFNNWTREHVAQGFSWRPGSISFRTKEEAGDYKIMVSAKKESAPISESAFRVIQVPFNVPKSGNVEIASITDGVKIDVPLGECSLRYEEEPGEVILLTFIYDGSKDFRVIRSDEELNPKYPLITTAEPA